MNLLMERAMMSVRLALPSCPCLFVVCSVSKNTTTRTIKRTTTENGEAMPNVCMYMCMSMGEDAIEYKKKCESDQGEEQTERRYGMYTYMYMYVYICLCGWMFVRLLFMLLSVVLLIS
ncbi:MAG: hypothetical protein BYD32DRAFT_278329 [Podila humilis]|nr:MAG: hypothetical protein BYD32DRAFT_278329 [Podila humilis]